MTEILRCWLPIDLRGILLFDAATYQKWVGKDIQSKVFGTGSKKLSEVQESRAVYIPSPEDTIDVCIYTGRQSKPQGFILFNEAYSLDVPSGKLVLTTELPLFEWNPLARGKTQRSLSIPPGRYHVSATGYIRQAKKHEAGAFELSRATGRGKPGIEYPVVRAVMALDVQMKRATRPANKRLSLGDGFQLSGQTEKLIVQHFCC